MLRTLLDAARSAGVVSLGGLGALHVLWATGRAWPAPDRATLADAIGGFSEIPGPRACLTVAALLALASSCVAGRPRPIRPVAGWGSAAAALVLLIRAGVGLAGRMPNSRRSPAFARLDRRVYSPVCLALAIMTLTGALRR